jgi:hypothetical protein
MPGFQIHFGNDGNVIVDNIEGAPGGQCMDLTAPYENALGVKERIEILEGCEQVPAQRESA